MNLYSRCLDPRALRKYEYNKLRLDYLLPCVVNAMYSSHWLLTAGRCRLPVAR